MSHVLCWVLFLSFYTIIHTITAHNGLNIWGSYYVLFIVLNPLQALSFHLMMQRGLVFQITQMVYCRTKVLEGFLGFKYLTQSELTWREATNQNTHFRILN